MTRDELAALRAKYEEMLRLRLDTSGADPRKAMAALASQFPGALREIDDLPVDALRARSQELADAEAGGSVALWMEAIHLFHVLTRGALCAKRWLGGRKVVDAAACAAFEQEAEGLCWGDDARLWGPHLARLASPPKGRVTELVYEAIGARLRVTAEDAKLLAFGVPRRQRREISS
ncbi:MAG TPA: hypothetical protein VGI39_40640 [Polyangiaceae bacterium]